MVPPQINRHLGLEKSRLDIRNNHTVQIAQIPAHDLHLSPTFIDFSCVRIKSLKPRSSRRTAAPPLRLLGANHLALQRGDSPGPPPKPAVPTARENSTVVPWDGGMVAEGEAMEILCSAQVTVIAGIRL